MGQRDDRRDAKRRAIVDAGLARMFEGSVGLLRSMLNASSLSSEAGLSGDTVDSLQAFVCNNVGPGSTVVTDGWPSPTGITRLGYLHEPHSQRAAATRGEDVGTLLPGVHRVASLAKRWVLGTHQGSVGDAYPQAYLNEFTFRFNRRRSHSSGLPFYRTLEMAVAHKLVRYRQLVADPRPKETPPAPPVGRGHPPSLDRPRADRPWRIT